jgi:hypothetical protein
MNDEHGANMIGQVEELDELQRGLIMAKVVPLGSTERPTLSGLSYTEALTFYNVNKLFLIKDN